MYVIEAHHGLFDIIGTNYRCDLQSFDCTNKIFEKVENYKNDSSYDKEAIYKNRDNLQIDDTGTDKNQV